MFEFGFMYIVSEFIAHSIPSKILKGLEGKI